MKASSFNYVKPRSIDQVWGLLKEHGSDAQILAGGQSLMAMLNLRMATPKILIDITALPDLRDITVTKDCLRIGALVTHSQVLASIEISKYVPLLSQAVPHVAHLAIRNSGTIGGSFALADPAAEYPAVALALQATIVLSGPDGERRVLAEDFFKGIYHTDKRPDELLVSVEFPKAQIGEYFVFDELTRRRGDYALCGLAAFVDVKGGVVNAARFAYLSMSDTPVLAQQAGTSLLGSSLTVDSINMACAQLVLELDPNPDLYGSVSSKKLWSSALLKRALITIKGSL